MKKRVEDLKEGDLVDLESCPYLNKEPMAEFEYAAVHEVERETADCVAVGYDNYWVGYRVGTVLEVKPEGA